MKKAVLIIISVIALCFAADIVINFPFGFGSHYGDSMEPTYFAGDWSFTNPVETPVIGDVISFKCQTYDKCDSINTVTAHRLVSIDSDGCMHIIGDNPKYNWDPKFCLYPNEINIIGVEHKVWPLPSIF